MVDTLIHSIGGQDSINLFIERFYARLTTDSRTLGRFEGRDIEHIKSGQKCYMGRLFGGDIQYTGPSMREVHAGMNISNEEYHIVIGIAGEVLTDMGVPAEKINLIATALLGLRLEIVELK